MFHRRPPAEIVPYAVDDYECEVDPTSTKSVGVSFTTGPAGPETHWKQVVFMLREPMQVQAGKQST